ASIPQAFTMLNGKIEDSFIQNSKSYIHTLITTAKKTEDKIEVAFLAILSREPTYSEMNLFKELFKNQKNSTTIANDLIWSLVNTNEFIFRR
ncbi:MAG: hypothetical protein NE330_14100, partial [Lentisphaeraceae bacterium]|nr:hypothetical protein [Lentisphaeraceae bacterium]